MGDLVPADDLTRVAAELAQLAAEAEELVAEEATMTTALVPVGDQSPVQLKARLATTRSALARKRSAVEAKSAELRSVMEERMSAALAVIEPMRQQMAKLEEGIWSINLYLGRDEELVQLRDGEPAPAETPISVRQQVLAMDEECAVAAEQGGIDARTMDEFDLWLLADPEHLDQVLPEPKGVVALVPRRKERDYGDPWTNEGMRKANSQTYFLVRNGDKLYRTSTEFQAGARLVPTRDEFTAMFSQERYDHDLGRRVTVQLHPGSRDWERAEQAAEGRQRHFMRVALILQGLVDRTPVFHPLPGIVDLLGPDSYDAGHVQIVMDDDLALGTGAESFSDWRARLAKDLRVGMRVIGAFNTEDARYANSEHRSRVYPPGAPSPRSGQVLTLEDRSSDGHGFVVRYERTDKRYGREFPDEVSWRQGAWGEWPYKVRASYTLHAEDSWVLPFDQADVATMRRFLSARSERASYASMFPVLKAAIRAKEEEAEAEAPFRMLLAGMIVAASGLDLLDAEDEAGQLMEWWKFANRHHRPVVLDPEAEGQALQAMVAEWSRRQADRARAHVDAELVAKLRDLHPTAIAVARKRDGALTVVVPADPTVPVYVHEFAYTTKGEPAKAGAAMWRLVGGRAARWTILWESDAWATWDRHASASEHLTGPEQDELVAAVRRMAKPGEQVVAIAYSEDTKRRDPWGEPIASHALLYVVSGELEVPEGHWAYAKPRDLRRMLVGWKRTTGGAVQALSRGWGRAEEVNPRRRRSSHQADLPWEQYDARWVDHDLAWALQQEQAVVAEHNELAAAWSHRQRQLINSVEEAWTVRAEAEAHARFMEDYADPDLWEGHRKTLRLNFPWPIHSHHGAGWLEAVVAQLLQRGVDLNGVTVADALAMAGELPDDQWGPLRVDPKMLADIGTLTFTEPDPEAEADEEEADEEEADELEVVAPTVTES